MSVAKYDLIVVGGGPAGEKDAAQAVYFGKKVALERASALGGSVASASIPFKALWKTALYLAGFRTRKLHGIDFR
jgi:NAD(P) transhydrogenase